jgi:hypothetical protein
VQHRKKSKGGYNSKDTLVATRKKSFLVAITKKDSVATRQESKVITTFDIF